MLLSAFVLIPIDCEHDSLQQGIDLGHGDEAAKMCNVPRLGLKEEEEVTVFLRFLIVWESTLFDVCSIVQVACKFVLLESSSVGDLYIQWSGVPARTYLLDAQTILNQQRYSRVQVSHVLLEHEVSLALRGYLGLQIS